jgi:NitT/TauT family transport system substrate-binding protein
MGRAAMRKMIGKLAAALVMAMGTVPCGLATVHGATLQKVRLTLPVNAVVFMPIYVAVANKYFEAEGIEAEIVVTQGDGPDIQALLAKDVEFSVSSPHHLYTVFHEGKRLLGILSVANRCVINFVIHKEVARERGLTDHTPLAEKLKGLKGLSIGVTRVGTLTYYLATYFVKKAGLDPKRDVKIIGAGAGPTLIAALENRKVDVFATSAPTPEQAIARGRAQFLINNAMGEDPDLRDFLMEVLYVRPDYVRDNPETVGKVVRALLRAEAWISKEPADTVAKNIAGHFGTIAPDILLASVKSVREAIPPDGRLSERGSDAYQDVLLAAGALKGRVPFNAVFSSDYLRGKER